jgi:hypothetical protein
MGQVTTMATPSRNCEFKKKKSQLLIKFHVIWLNNLKFVERPKSKRLILPPFGL